MSSNPAFTCWDSSSEEGVPEPRTPVLSHGVVHEAFVYTPEEQSRVMEILQMALLNFTFAFSSS